MGGEMGTHLQQTLRSLCFKTEWKYAVFWKLNHGARTILTWEDAYYNNHEFLHCSKNMCFSAPHAYLHDGCSLQDPLGLALAKMSCFVYSLGEGIIGQVAVTGKHQWLCEDMLVSNSWSSSEFSAGIRTIAVVAVVPLGVVQLGSSNTVIEDFKFVTHIKDVFCSLQNSCLELFSNPIQYSKQTILCSKEPVEYLGFESPILWGDGSAQFLQPRSRMFDPEQQKEVQMKLLKVKKFGEGTSGLTDICVNSRHVNPPVSHNSHTENGNLNSILLPVDKSGADYLFLPGDLLNSAVRDRIKCDRIVSFQNEGLHLPRPLEMHLGKGLENSEFQSECTNTVNTSLKFPTGYEMHKVFGSDIRREQQNDAFSEAERTGIGTPIELKEGMCSSPFTPECVSEHHLKAVVANACQDANTVQCETSFCKSSDSLVTTEKIPQIPTHVEHACGSAGGPTGQSFLVEEDTHHRGSKEVFLKRSQKELSSTTLSTCSELLGRPVEPSKINKKRARPGETRRPRPRDRQLIQDLVKELRELVPNGSKCSIDVLLEHTIKHILFLQNISKHIDRLKKCAESKFNEGGMGLLGSCSHEHGSSWVLEVGSQTEVCPIMVKSLNMNGQFLVEMLCEECSHFLEIAEALKGLGLTILKGLTEARGEKTWACFVVEGQGNKSMHRMDILWSLLQLLQPETTI